MWRCIMIREAMNEKKVPADVSPAITCLPPYHITATRAILPNISIRGDVEDEIAAAFLYVDKSWLSIVLALDISYSSLQCALIIEILRNVSSNESVKFDKWEYILCATACIFLPNCSTI